MKIFVVDDDRLTLNRLSQTLEGWGHEVYSFASSLEALAAFADADYVDLVITDWVMPDTDGIALSQSLRKFRKAHRVFLVMLTSRSDREEKIKALQAGVDSFLTKPVDEAELQASLLVAQRQLDMQLELKDRVKQLTQARQEAEKAALAKQNFLAQMSHELRTPMQAVLTTFETLKGTKLGLEQSELLSLAEGSAKGLLRILNDILDFSKLESEMMTFQQSEFSMSQVVYESLASLRLRAIEAGLSFKCSIDSQQDRVLGDSGRLAQILVNVVGNALKFTTKGGVSISIAHRERAGDVWTFVVSDTGPGIPEEALETVFKPFVQNEHECDQVVRGTGLGLPLCRSMAEGMEGSLVLESEVGTGTVVTLELPLPATQPSHDPRWQDYRHLSFRTVGEFPEAERILLARGLQKAEGNVDFLLGSIPPSSVVADNFIWIAQRPEETLSSQQEVRPKAILHPPILEHSLLRALVSSHSNSALAETDVKNLARVLLVEDNPINRKVMASALGKRGLTVETADNGKQAIEKRLAHEFDVIFMDMQMPVLDGVQATQAIRKWELQNQRRASRIVGLTAHTLEEAEREFLKAGANSVMTKPVPIADLLTVIEDFRKSKHES